MKEKLIKLYNTMSQIETKGENTKLMAQCLTYVAQMVGELEREQKSGNEAGVEQ